MKLTDRVNQNKSTYSMSLFYLIRRFILVIIFFFFQAEDGIRDVAVTGVQTCALPISRRRSLERERGDHGGRGNDDQQASEPVSHCEAFLPCPLQRVSDRKSVV